MRLLRFFLSTLPVFLLLLLPVVLSGHTFLKAPVHDHDPAVEPGAESVEPLRPPDDAPLWTRLHILDSVRRPVDFEGSIEVNYPAARGTEVRLLSLDLIHEGRVISGVPLATTLAGDGGWYASLHADLEKLPPELSYIYTNRRDYPIEYHRTLTREEILRLRDDVERRTEEAQQDGEFLARPPVRLIRFDVPMSRLVRGGGVHPGGGISLTIRLRFDRGEGEEEIRLEHIIRIEEPMPAGPTGPVVRGGEEILDLQGTWHSGDLHVHDCKDETSIIGERGCPTCWAESLNWGDENTLGALKNQYIAKGADWFTITSHSYCVESEAEYNGVRADANALSGPGFLVIPDTELQSEERGPQEGDDDGNVVCWDGVNHMGAHWIRSWKPGGSDGLLQFCSNPITDFLTNVESIRAEGGFGIINHPTGTSWVWNSYELTQGFNHPQGLRGVEIWNGPTRVGQGGGVGWWVRNLLDGRPMYAFSGSDTHDDVFDFGWNHTYVMGAFTSDNLRDALMRGRNYVSNFQTLVILLHDLSSDLWANMGSGLPIAPGGDIELGIYYDFGTKTGNIHLYKGVVGDASETLFHQETGLTGSGWLYVEDLSPASSGFAYYRAYSNVTSGGTFTAYTNPVYVRIVP